MMTVNEAILKVNQIYMQGWEAQQQEFRADSQAARRALDEANRNQRLREYLEELSTHSSGPVSVTQSLLRSIGSCPHCGAFFNAGSYRVRHLDGREVRFDIGLVHSARAQHPIAEDDVDAETLLAIMAEA